MYQELCRTSKETHLKTSQYGQTRKKLEKRWRRQGHFVWCGVFLQCSKIDGDCLEIFQSQFENPRISPVEFSLDTACWSKKQDAGLLTDNAKRIFCHNVTCFGTNKCCSSRSHLQECFKCSSLLACKGTAFNLFSNLSFPHTPCSFPLSVSCRLLSRHSVPTSGEFSLEQVGISWHFSNISSDISALWAHVSTSIDVNKANAKARTLACWQFKTLIVLCASIYCGKILLSAHPFWSDTLDSSTDLAPKMKASQFGRQRTAGALLNDSANLTAKKSLFDM